MRRRGGGSAAAPPALDHAAVVALQGRILDWYAVNRRDLPWRDTTDPYAILVSEVMAQQTQIARVVPKYEQWLRRFPDLATLAAAPTSDVLDLWMGLGYNSRAVRLQRCAQAAGAALPRDYETLRRLPGLGPYTARAVLVFAYNNDLAAVDANVRRVLTHELGLPADLGPRQLQAMADAVLPHGRARDWHNALMDYGALVLTARHTGIAPRTRQSPFAGSRRQRRAALLRATLERGQTSVGELAASLGIDGDEASGLVADLARDGLLERRGDAVRIATTTHRPAAERE